MDRNGSNIEPELIPWHPGMSGTARAVVAKAVAVATSAKAAGAATENVAQASKRLPRITEGHVYDMPFFYLPNFVFSKIAFESIFMRSGQEIRSFSLKDLIRE